MNQSLLTKFSKLIDKLSAFLAAHKGLLPMLGIVFIFLNFILQITAAGFIQETNLFLHLGIIVAIIGFLLAWAL